MYPFFSVFRGNQYSCSNLVCLDVPCLVSSLMVTRKLSNDANIDAKRIFCTVCKKKCLVRNGVPLVNRTRVLRTPILLRLAG